MLHWLLVASYTHNCAIIIVIKFINFIVRQLDPY